MVKEQDKVGAVLKWLQGIGTLGVLIVVVAGQMISQSRTTEKLTSAITQPLENLPTIAAEMKASTTRYGEFMETFSKQAKDERKTIMEKVDEIRIKQESDSRKIDALMSAVRELADAIRCGDQGKNAQAAPANGASG